ncbi:hypothetical protein DENSPDRAFT_226076 [Dentipellis sp. KUC8613]|nr:hypothetical protein DENSPDRAFT_226076 [Dentipellis sp. KUC8613]
MAHRASRFLGYYGTQGQHCRGTAALSLLFLSFFLSSLMHALAVLSLLRARPQASQSPSSRQPLEETPPASSWPYPPLNSTRSSFVSRASDPRSEFHPIRASFVSHDSRPHSRAAPGIRNCGIRSQRPQPRCTRRTHQATRSSFVSDGGGGQRQQETTSPESASSPDNPRVLVPRPKPLTPL